MTTIFTTLLIAVSGGYIFYLLHVPLAWMLGSLTAVVIAGISNKFPLVWPIQIRNGALLFLGYSMGRPFTLAAGQQIINNLPLMAVTTVLTVAVSLVIGYYTQRKTGITMASSLLGSVPGGLSQMVVLCDEIADSDLAVVTFMQTARLLAVVFVVPFMAVNGITDGASGVTPVESAVSDGNLTAGQLILIVTAVLTVTGVAVRWHWPTPYLLGPIIGAALVVLIGTPAPELPNYLVNAAQTCVGAYMGVSIKLSSLDNWRKLLPYTLLGVAGVLAVSLGLGYVLARWWSFSLVTAFLSTAPGGMAEMGLTALLLHADLSAIVAFQLFRLLFILLCVPPILKWLLSSRANLG